MLPTIKVQIPLDAQGLSWLQIEAENMSQVNKELLDVAKGLKDLRSAAQNLIRSASEGTRESAH